MPIWLSSGLTDPMATPAQQRAVRASMLGAGFKNVRLGTSAGTHALDAAQLAAGLGWFAAPRSVPGPPRRPPAGEDFTM